MARSEPRAQDARRPEPPTKADAPGGAPSGGRVRPPLRSDAPATPCRRHRERRAMDGPQRAMDDRIGTMEVEGKHVIVTGGAGGIGAALCERFAAEGARGVVVADHDA